MRFSIRTLLAATTACAVLTIAYIAFAPASTNNISPDGYVLTATASLPNAAIYWFTRESDGEMVSGLLVFGDYPQVMISGEHCNFYIPALGNERIPLPQDGAIYILSPSMSLVRSELDLKDTVKIWRDYATWGSGIKEEIEANEWPETDWPR